MSEKTPKAEAKTETSAEPKVGDTVFLTAKIAPLQHPETLVWFNPGPATKVTHDWWTKIQLEAGVLLVASGD